MQLFDFQNSLNVGLFLGGISLGAIFGTKHGYSDDPHTKNLAFKLFTSVLITAIGGGIYFYVTSNSLDKFNIFTIFYGITFGIVSLIARVIHKQQNRTIYAHNMSMAELIRNHGRGFTAEDSVIYNAVVNHNLSRIPDIAKFCNISKRKVRKRIKYMEEKGALISKFDNDAWCFTTFQLNPEIEHEEQFEAKPNVLNRS